MSLHFAKLADPSESLCLDLSDPLSPDAKLFSNFSKRVLFPVDHSCAHPQNVRRAFI